MARQLTIIYTPVRHEDGSELVQVCNGDFDHFAGFADGRGRYDVPGSWEVAENWTAAQSAEYARAVQGNQNNLGKSCVETGWHRDGISRTITVTY